MLIDAMGLILADNNNIQLGELTKPRALAAVPFAGRYRIIDFSLSNMVNSGIISVGVLTSNKYKSLMDHLGNGSAWDLSRKSKGLFILPPFISSESFVSSSRGNIDGLSRVLDFFRMNRQKYVVATESNIVLNTTFNEMVKDYEESGADISILYNNDGVSENGLSVILDTDQTGRVNEVYFKPLKPVSTKASLGIFVIRRELLIDLITESISKGESEFTFDIMIRKCRKYKIRAFEFKGVCLRINSIQSYFSSSMRLMEKEIRDQLFMTEQRVYTKVKDEAPALYSADCDVSRALIADGCKINGKVYNSMLFRGVTVSTGACINNSIIMQNAFISERCELENVIIDKNVMLRPGIKLIGQANYPVVIGKGSIV